MLKAVLKVDKLLIKYNMSQTQLAKASGVRRAAINEMMHNKRGRIELEYVNKIASCLGIVDIREVIDFIEVDEEVQHKEDRI